MAIVERVVVDTNVFVGRLLRITSVPGRAAGQAMHNSLLLVSASTMAELTEVLAREKFDRYVTVRQRTEFIRLISKIAEFVPTIHRIRECRDPKDDMFLEVALNGRADLILTSDRDLLALNPWRGVAILSPKDYLNKG